MLACGNTGRRRRRNPVCHPLWLASGAVGAAGLVLAAQACVVALTTPRLPPPEECVPEDGLLVECGDSHREELRLVLLGDSPAAGIGNATHEEALGGRTAAALCRVTGRPVRYWVYARSGLTARGVTEEMVPRLRGIAGGVDVVVVSCGVNNVLAGQSAAAFREEVENLLDAIAAVRAAAKVIVLELVDFAFLPFLPWPLSGVCSWRSRALQRELAAAVRDRGDGDLEVGMAHLPDVPALLENRRHHPLLEHISSREEREALALSDFFADDDFHPAGHGTVILGIIITNTYKQLCPLQ